MRENKNERQDGLLVSLSRMSGYRVAKGEADIRGWDVVTRDHRKIGNVHELIVDPGSLKVRYLDVALHKTMLETKDKTHILIPIAGATLDDDDNRIYMEDITAADIEAIPPYDHRPITRQYETMLRNIFAREAAGPATPPPPVVTEGDEFYEHPQFSERRFWGRRRAGREDQQYLARDEDIVAPPPVEPERRR
jgi:hypothetical protein